jgi:hypothetical protein
MGDVDCAVAGGEGDDVIETELKMVRNETHLDYATPARPRPSWIEQVDLFHLALLVIRRVVFALGCAALAMGVCASINPEHVDGPRFAALGAGIIGLTIRVPWATWRNPRDEQEG